MWLKGGGAYGEAQSERRRQHPQTERRKIGGPVYSRPGPGHREAHLQECPGQDPGGGQGKAEKGDRGQPAVRHEPKQELHSGELDQVVVRGLR